MSKWQKFTLHGVHTLVTLHGVHTLVRGLKMGYFWGANLVKNSQKPLKSAPTIYCGVPGLPCLSKSFDSYIDLNFCYPVSVKGIKVCLYED